VAALFLTSATPHALKYRFEADALSIMVTKTQAELLADTVAGPLRDLLKRTTQLGLWQRLPLEGQMSVNVYRLVDTIAAAREITVQFGQAGPDNIVNFVNASPLDADTQSLVEFRFHHTIKR
jgi:hypothetical protein